MVETNDLGSNGFTYAMKRQSHVSLVKLGVGSNGTFHNSLVVSKHVAPATDGNSEVPPERQSRVHDLLKASVSSHIFRSIRCSFDGHLFLRIPINWCLVHQV
jgi:hypothetical protein